MLKGKKMPNPVVVDLTDKISVSTNIPKVNHGALRSGFAGYPPNPRWSTAKYLAWKTGSKLKKALAEGKTIVGSQDSMLVSVEVQAEKPSVELSHSKFFFLFARAKQLLPN